MIEKTATDFSKVITSQDLESKLEPVHKAIDDMLTRLEEFETLVSFVKPDVTDSRDILTSTSEYKEEFDELCNKIDTVEFLIEHIKTNLETLEENIEKSEKKLGVSDSTTSAVTSILSPFFKKNIEKKSVGSQSFPGISDRNLQIFNPEDYFNNNSE